MYRARHNLQHHQQNASSFAWGYQRRPSSVGVLGTALLCTPSRMLHTTTSTRQHQQQNQLYNSDLPSSHHQQQHQQTHPNRPTHRWADEDQYCVAIPHMWHELLSEHARRNRLDSNRWTTRAQGYWRKSTPPPLPAEGTTTTTTVVPNGTPSSNNTTTTINHYTYSDDSSKRVHMSYIPDVVATTQQNNSGSGSNSSYHHHNPQPQFKARTHGVTVALRDLLAPPALPSSLGYAPTAATSTSFSSSSAAVAGLSSSSPLQTTPLTHLPTISSSPLDTVAAFRKHPDIIFINDVSLGMQTEIWRRYPLTSRQLRESRGWVLDLSRVGVEGDSSSTILSSAEAVEALFQSVAPPMPTPHTSSDDDGGWGAADYPSNGNGSDAFASDMPASLSPSATMPSSATGGESFDCRGGEAPPLAQASTPQLHWRPATNEEIDDTIAFFAATTNANIPREMLFVKHEGLALRVYDGSLLTIYNAQETSNPFVLDASLCHRHAITNDPIGYHDPEFLAVEALSSSLTSASSASSSAAVAAEGPATVVSRASGGRKASGKTSPATASPDAGEGAAGGKAALLASSGRSLLEDGDDSEEGSGLLDLGKMSHQQDVTPPLATTTDGEAVITEREAHPALISALTSAYSIRRFRSLRWIPANELSGTAWRPLRDQTPVMAQLPITTPLLHVSQLQYVVGDRGSSGGRGTKYCSLLQGKRHRNDANDPQQVAAYLREESDALQQKLRNRLPSRFVGKSNFPIVRWGFEEWRAERQLSKQLETLFASHQHKQQNQPRGSKGRGGRGGSSSPRRGRGKQYSTEADFAQLALSNPHQTLALQPLPTYHNTPVTENIWFCCKHIGDIFPHMTLADLGNPIPFYFQHHTVVEYYNVEQLGYVVNGGALL